MRTSWHPGRWGFRRLVPPILACLVLLASRPAAVVEERSGGDPASLLVPN
ncbi:MAG: hypothetical protein Q8O14_07860 [bacterium]|jgi:hypothetical protein|nr:hypothetical protein [bacterium]